MLLPLFFNFLPVIKDWSVLAPRSHLAGGMTCHDGNLTQPRSQGLSSLPPLVVGRKTWLRLVTLPPRIWVAKKSVGWEGWQSVLFG